MSSPDERRRLPRRRTQLSALIVHGDPLETLACTIRDKNDMGAKLLVQPGTHAPDAFRLLELRSGELHAARVVWRDKAFVGVALEGGVSLETSRDPALTPLAEIWRRAIAR